MGTTIKSIAHLRKKDNNKKQRRTAKLSKKNELDDQQNNDLNKYITHKYILRDEDEKGTTY